jgi:hypothetical protein
MRLLNLALAFHRAALAFAERAGKTRQPACLEPLLLKELLYAHLVVHLCVAPLAGHRHAERLCSAALISTPVTRACDVPDSAMGSAESLRHCAKRAQQT